MTPPHPEMSRHTRPGSAGVSRDPFTTMILTVGHPRQSRLGSSLEFPVNRTVISGVREVFLTPPPLPVPHPAPERNMLCTVSPVS